MADDEKYMCLALEEAKAARDCGEVPVGAVIVYGGKVVASGRNRREGRQNALMHAEIEAIDGACSALGRWRLGGCALYVTLEPCPMCAGAIVASRIDRVVIGARDPKAGACGSVIDIFACPFGHCPDVQSGVLGKECSALLCDFFSSIRRDGL